VCPFFLGTLSLKKEMSFDSLTNYLFIHLQYFKNFIIFTTTLLYLLIIVRFVVFSMHACDFHVFNVRAVNSSACCAAQLFSILNVLILVVYN